MQNQFVSADIEKVLLIDTYWIFIIFRYFGIE